MPIHLKSKCPAVKSLWTLGSRIAALVALAGTGHAETIGVELFEYARIGDIPGPGEIQGRSGGFYWDNRNTPPAAHTGTPSDWDVAFGSPEVAGPAGHRQLITQNAGVVREYNGPGELFAPGGEVEGAVNSGSEARKVYYRVKFTRKGPVNYAGVSSYDFGTERIFFGIPAGQTNFGVEISGGALALSTVPSVAGTAYTLVMRLDFEGDNIALWVNPPPTPTEPLPTVSLPYTGTNWSTAVRLASSGESAVEWDDLAVATTWAEVMPREQQGYYFNSGTRRIETWSGVRLGSVKGVSPSLIADQPDAVEFHFNSSLTFDGADAVYFKGPKPVRIVVNGNVTIPAGMVVSADPQGNVSGAGGGPGATGGAGGKGAIPVSPHQLGQTSLSNPGGQWERLITDRGHAYVLPRPGQGGSGGGVGGPARAGGAGQPGRAGASNTLDGREWTDGQPLLYGYAGAVPGALRYFNAAPGYQPVGAPSGGSGWRNGGPAAAGGLAGFHEIQGVGAFLPTFVYDTLPAGGGGTGGFAGPSGTNAVGGKGFDGGHGAAGADGHLLAGAEVPRLFGTLGQNGTYEANSADAPVLRGGHGGGGGGGGAGGSAGAAGGAGGGGGGGGSSSYNNGANFASGGAGGAGGMGGFGGAGGDGGAGGSGGSGGGAFEISASGQITVGGMLTARGGAGADGNGGQAGQPGTDGMPGHPEYVVDWQGKEGSAGFVSGPAVGGTGGRGGDGGPGGSGLGGSYGVGGGGGSGGTIILRAGHVSFTGNSSPAAHLHVNGGLRGADHSESLLFLSYGANGAFFIIPTPGIGLSQNTFNYTINRGDTLGVSPSFNILNMGPAGSVLRWVIDPPWWMTPLARSGTLASGGSFAQSLTLDTKVLGGGNYSFGILVRDADPAAQTVPVLVTIDLTVNGLPDDHFDALLGGTPIPSGMGRTVGGNLEIPGDQDVFRIEVTQPGTIEAWTTGGLDTSGQLLNAQGVVLTSGLDQFLDRNFRFSHNVAPGVYFIRVSAPPNAAPATGAYVLHVNVHQGTAPFTARLDRVNNANWLTWDAQKDQTYSLIGSPDLTRWQLADSRLFSGSGAPISLGMTLSGPRQFYRVVRGGLFPVMAASLLSSASSAGTGGVFSATPGITVTAGVPPDHGDTALLGNGVPLTAGTGILMASAATSPFENYVVQAPSPVTATSPPGFPAQGHWLATSGRTAGSDRSAVTANAAWFPANAGWLGGRVVNGVVTAFNFEVPDFFYTFGENDSFSATRFALELSKEFSEETWPNRPILLYGGPLATSLNFEGPLTQGAWLSCGAGGNAQPVVTGIKDFNLANSISGLTFYVWKPDGTLWSRSAPFNFAFIPYNTPGIVAGRVMANGTSVPGTGNYTVSNVSAGVYRLNPDSGFGPDLSKGTLLVTAFDSNPNCLMTYAYPAGGGIEITATRLPLTGTPSPTPCGFYFAYIPHDRMIFGPGKGQ